MAMSVEPEESFRAPASDPPAYIRQKSYISEKTGQSSTQLKVSIRCLISVWLLGVTLVRVRSRVAYAVERKVSPGEKVYVVVVMILLQLCLRSWTRVVYMVYLLIKTVSHHQGIR